jgi:hypothetical protein
VLMTILGELRPTSGRVVVNGSTFFAAQEPWVISVTIRENITFGSDLDEHWYDEGKNARVCVCTSCLCNILSAGALILSPFRPLHTFSS